MEKINFEVAFGDFIDRCEYDQAEEALFFITRTAFTAGWLAAGGNLLECQRIVERNKENTCKITKL